MKKVFRYLGSGLFISFFFSASLFAEKIKTTDLTNFENIATFEKTLESMMLSKDNDQALAWDNAFRVELADASEHAEYMAILKTAAKFSKAKAFAKKHEPLLLILANSKLNAALAFAQSANKDGSKISFHDTLSLSLKYSSSQDFRKKRGRLPRPVEGAVKTKFGVELLKNTRAEIRHSGVSFDVPIGSEVKTIGKGLVVFAREFEGYGKLVIIDHGSGVHSIYGFLSKIHVIQGEEIRGNKSVGLSGATRENGPELYFEIRLNGEAVDPEPFLIF